MIWPFPKRSGVKQMTEALPRSEILRRARIAILDDDTPEMLEDLRNTGLSIDHMKSTADVRFTQLQIAFYDLLLLDYGGIGTNIGKDEGLDVLRLLKRVNPSLRVLAFTGRTFDSSKADFFRLCHDVVKKDSGIRETLEKIEFHLGQVMTPAFQASALESLSGSTRAETKEVDKVLNRAVSFRLTLEEATTKILSIVGTKAGSEIVKAIVTKIVEFAKTYRGH